MVCPVVCPAATTMNTAARVLCRPLALPVFPRTSSSPHGQQSPARRRSGPSDGPEPCPAPLQWVGRPAGWAAASVACSASVWPPHAACAPASSRCVTKSGTGHKTVGRCGSARPRRPCLAGGAAMKTPMSCSYRVGSWAHTTPGVACLMVMAVTRWRPSPRSGCHRRLLRTCVPPSLWCPLVSPSGLPTMPSALWMTTTTLTWMPTTAAAATARYESKAPLNLVTASLSIRLGLRVTQMSRRRVMPVRCLRTTCRMPLRRSCVGSWTWIPASSENCIAV